MEFLNLICVEDAIVNEMVSPAINIDGQLWRKFSYTLGWKRRIEGWVY